MTSSHTGKDTCVLSAKDFVQYLKDQNQLAEFAIPDTMIFTYFPAAVQHIIGHQKVDSNLIRFHRQLSLLRAPFNIFKYKNKNIGILSEFGIGAPALTTYFELFIGLGVKNFLKLGMAGAIQPHLKGGDLVICDRAWIDEGCSRHYNQTNEYSYPDLTLHNEVLKVLSTSKLNYQVGTTWTTDAIYRETLKKLNLCQNKGFMTVEMEASAFYTVARFYGVKASSLFVISDSLASGRWEPQFHNKQIKQTATRTMEAILNV